LSPLAELHALPPLLGDWAAVQRLDLRGCAFLQAPNLEELKQLPNLIEIDLRQNPLRHLPRKQLSDLAAYRVLISK
jgi:hypothetical protein